MEAKFAGRCALCKEPIPAGMDVFYEKPLGVMHWNCHDNPKPTAEARKMASDLGFLDHSQAMQISWPRRHVYEALVKEQKTGTED